MIETKDTGFIVFPENRGGVKKVDSGKTQIYIVAFDVSNISNQNINLFMPGIFVSDDVLSRPEFDHNQLSIDELIADQEKNNQYDSLYFPNLKSISDLERCMSISMSACICIGWSDYTYEVSNQIKFWNASFRDLTNEGRKLYFSMKKLHSNKEIRILTFNNI